MTKSAQIQECEDQVALFRRNIADLQSERDELRRRIDGLRRAIREIEDRKDTPGFRLRIGELQAEIGAIEQELEMRRPQLEYFRERLQEYEQKCWELRRQGAQEPPDQDALRKAVDDPRYWRDGDPVLSRFVSEGFKRLYPEDSET